MDIRDEMITQIEFESYKDYLEKQEPSKEKDVKYIMEILKQSCH